MLYGVVGDLTHPKSLYDMRCSKPMFFLNWLSVDVLPGLMCLAKVFRKSIIMRESSMETKLVAPKSKTTYNKAKKPLQVL